MNRSTLLLFPLLAAATSTFAAAAIPTTATPAFDAATMSGLGARNIGSA